MMGGGVAAALPSLARAGTAASDVAILNFALTLEYLEAAFYAEAVKYAGKFDAKTAHFARVVAKHEAAHVAFLTSALGAAAVKKPIFNFKGSNHAMASFQATSQVLEDTGVAAYSGQGGNIKSEGDSRRCGLDPHSRGTSRELDGDAPRHRRRTDRVRQGPVQGADPHRGQGHRLHRRLAPWLQRREGVCGPPSRRALPWRAQG
jgi:Ferritin-like domain